MKGVCFKNAYRAVYLDTVWCVDHRSYTRDYGSYQIDYRRLELLVLCVIRNYNDYRITILVYCWNNNRYSKII